MWVLSFQDPTKFGELWTAYQFHCKTRGKETVVGSETLFNLVWRKRFLYTKVVAIRRNKGIISLCLVLLCFTEGVRGGLCIDCAEIKFMGDNAR